MLADGEDKESRTGCRTYVDQGRQRQRRCSGTGIILIAGCVSMLAVWDGMMICSKPTKFYLTSATNRGCQ